MEPVTHFLTGACLARTGFNRRTAYATLAMTLAAEAPDIDVLWSLRGPVAGFEHHRGITHTFLGAPFVALAVTGLVWLWHRVRKQQPPIPPRWTIVWLLSLLAALSHIFMDWTNNYGVRPFYPFNPRWYSLDIAFILEPVVFAALLTGLVMPAILGLVGREMGATKPLFRGRGWAIAAMFVVGIDLGVRAVEHHRALHILANAGFGDQPLIRVGAEPYPVDPFHWFGLAETRDYFQTSLVNTWAETVDTHDQDDVIFKPPVTAAVMAAKQSWLGRVYLDWAQFPLATDDPQNSTVELRDLRFAYSFLARQGKNGHSALSARVYVKPNGTIEALEMNGRQQH
jgi:inner membrane protein